MDIVELAKALAWPIATVVVVLSITFMTWLIVSRKGHVNLSFWDKFKFTAESIASAGQSPQVVPDGSVSALENSTKIDTEAPLSPGSRAVALDESQEEWGMKFIFSKTIAQLEFGFERAKLNSKDYDPELWETIYLDKRFELGGGGGDDELRGLATRNPTWVAPLAILIRRSVRNHNLEAAEGAFAMAVQRQQSKHFDWALLEGVKLHYRMRGPKQALQFCLDWLKSAIGDDAKTDMLSSLANLMKDDGKTDGYRMVLEIALTIAPVRPSRRFGLAYNYSETRPRWPAVFEHYRRLIHDESEGAMSLNNLGVTLRDFDKPSAIDAQERAMAAGNPLAISNLAQSLIHDGYIAAGERLLDGVRDPGSAAENIALTRASALAARREMERRRTEIYSIGEQSFGLFRSALLQSFRFIQNDKIFPIGEFSSTDGRTRVYIDSAGAACRLSSATLTFDGVLADQVLGYAGTVSSQGSSLFDVHSRDAIVLPVSESTLRLVLWPNSVNLSAKLEVIDLERVRIVPERQDQILLPMPGNSI